MDSLELSTLKLELLNIAQDLVLSIYKGTANELSEEEMTYEIIDIANKYLLFVGEDDLKFNILLIAHNRVMETDCAFLEEKTQSVLDIATKYLAYTDNG